jgi:S-DNA-T family DNA segregation ATPase FtsK/SpoIIIE
MESRLDEMDKTDATMYEGTDLYIVVDELAHLLQNGGQEVLRILTTISQLGRAARVHEILATQDPSRKVLAAQLVKNMTACLGLRCKDAIDSRQVIGRSGCELLPRHGVGILAEGADFRHIGLPLISEEEQAARIAWWSDPQNYLVGRR